MRARKAGVPFALTTGDVVIPPVCPVLGISLYTGRQGGGDHSPSLELIDPARGYVTGNVLVICALVKRIKSDATVEELEALVAFYEGLERRAR